ncbi:MAG: RecX family transcriptional regulator [Alistipes sp.]|nr:RecX family transcriptional regulator [Candidatus Alistipes equi]
MDVKRQKTPQQALQALEKLSAKAEKCSEDARRLLRRWNIDEREWDWILDSLYRNRFIDDCRYAGAFVREHASLSNWGPLKIRQSLLSKRISVEIVDDVMKDFFMEDVKVRLKPLLERKLKTLGDEPERKVREKLIRFALSKGYDIDDVLAIMSEILR